MLVNEAPTRPSKVRCCWLGLILVCLYLVDNPTAAALLGGGRFFSFVLKPFLYLGLAYLTWSLPEMGYKTKLRDGELLNLWAFVMGAVFIIISVLAGLILGFGQSPYDHSLVGIAGNLWLLGTTLVAREWVRYHLVANLARGESYLVFISIALFMTITNIPLQNYLKLADYTDYMGIVQFVAQTFAPGAAQNLLAVYLAYLGGPLPAMIYMGTLQGYNWLSPILPNLPWTIAALIGILCPVFCLSIMEQINQQEIRKVKSKAEEEGTLSWIITSIISIAIVWFTVGMFSIYPSVIATGSMEPLIRPGDIILVNKNVDKQNLQVGDIIQFKSEQILISHRIITVLGDEEVRRYQTKGDNNSAEDTDLIAPERIKGKIIKVIPKLGWPTLLIKSRPEIPLDRIQF